MIKTIIKPALIALSCAVITTGSAIANGVEKFATVDMKKLFDEYKETKSIQAQVKENKATIAKENEKKLVAIRDIAKKIAEYSKQIKDPVISPKRKQELARLRQDLANRGNMMDNNRLEWLKRRQNAINEYVVSEMRKVLKKIQDRVDAYAKANNIDIILDKSARGTTQTHVVTFVKDKYDITAFLLKEINKEVAPKKKDTAPTP